MPTPSELAAVLRRAVHSYECSKAGKIEQADLKPLTVLMVDDLIPSVPHPTAETRPVLYANGMNTRDEDRKWVIGQLRNADHDRHECLVDINVLVPMVPPFGEPYAPIITAESEGYSGHAAGIETPSASEENGLLWDFYKLLVVPSPLRLLTSRSPEQHHQRIAEALRRYLVAYAGQVFSPTGKSEVWSVQVPTGSLRYAQARIDGWRVHEGIVSDIGVTEITALV